MSRRTSQYTVFSDEMRWMPLEVAGSEGCAWIRTLSKDPKTGARTALIKFDPGFKQEKAISSWPMDMYTLEGEMQCGDMRFEPGTFHYRPAGVSFGPISTRTGTTRIIFTSDYKDRSSPDPVFVQNIADLPWKPSYMDPTDNKKRAVKLFRADPIAGYTIYLHQLRVPGTDSRAGLAHMHKHSEEIYILEGEMEDYQDEIEGHFHWRPGTYACRPPNEGLHGDSVVTKFPVSVLIRIGWVGDLPSFYAPGISETHSKDMPTAYQKKPDFFIE